MGGIDLAPDNEARIAELREEFLELKTRRDEGLTAQSLEVIMSNS